MVTRSTTQVPDLAGKPAATDRFVTGLLERGSRPPEDWKPAVAAPPVVPSGGTAVEGEGMEVDEGGWSLKEAVEVRRLEN